MREAPWGMVAAFALSAAVVSLVLSGERLERVAGWPAAYAVERGGLSWLRDERGRETRSAMMERTETQGAARNPPWDPVTAPVTERISATPGPSEGGIDIQSGSLDKSQDGSRGSSVFGEWLSQIESLIQRYPWPTVALGIGAGFLLSRRMRRGEVRHAG
jgi:hypothetical protein